MKKLTILFAAIALVCFAVPAMAVDWNFYGSARIYTFYISTDLGDTNDAAGKDGDAQLSWGNENGNNSRIGAKVKAESVSGRFELQLKGNADGDPGTYVSTETRLMYGQWDFGAGKLKVGKDYTPVSQFVAGQVFDEDLGLLGIGAQYGNRTPQIALNFGGFDLALIQQKSDGITTAAGAPTGGDNDSYLPKIEASYGMAFDTWNFGIQGGYQYYTIDTAETAVLDSQELDITSYTIGATAGVNFGPAYVRGAGSYGQNWGQAAWGLNKFKTDGSDAYWKGAGSNNVDDTTSYMALLAAGLKATDMLSFEAGFGIRNDNPDVDGADDQTAWAVYGQSVIVMAPGVYLVPEVGYYDYGDHFDGDDAGNQFYLGAKWQIDF
jgi:hypothetical protein